MFNRRSIIGGLAAAPIAIKEVGQTVAKAVAEMDAAAKVPSLNSMGEMAGDLDFSYTTTTSVPGWGTMPFHERVKAFLSNKAVMDEAMSRLYRENRHIQPSHLDYDIASKRSFSMAAKIAYQRQRLVESEIANLQQRGHNEGIINWLQRKLFNED